MHRRQLIKTREFDGTSNPRHLRAIQALLRRPITREQLDKVVGCSNGPDLIAQLRRRGLDIPCERISFVDRDGRKCRPGVYMTTVTDRRLIYRWLARNANTKLSHPCQRLHFGWPIDVVSATEGKHYDS